MSNFFNLLYKYFKIRSFFYFEECLKKTAKPATERVNGMENEERMKSGNKKKKKRNCSKSKNFNKEILPRMQQNAQYAVIHSIKYAQDVNQKESQIQINASLLKINVGINSTGTA